MPNICFGKGTCVANTFFLPLSELFPHTPVASCACVRGWPVTTHTGRQGSGGGLTLFTNHHVAPHYTSPHSKAQDTLASDSTNCRHVKTTFVQQWRLLGAIVRCVRVSERVPCGVDASPLTAWRTPPPPRGLQPHPSSASRARGLRASSPAAPPRPGTLPHPWRRSTNPTRG